MTTEFKKGDKVTHEESNFWPHTYTVVEQVTPDSVRVTDPDGLEYRLTPSYLTKVVEPGPKVGDRVRLVHEGVVTSTSGTGEYKAICIDGVARFVDKGEAVEILERAPKAYPVGTAIRYKTLGVAYPMLRDREGWRNHAGELVSTVTDTRVHAGEFEVIYEPPQSA